MTPASVSPGPGATAVRPSWRAGVAAATAATLARPVAWPVALAGLLVRGGIVPFALPIVVLPTMTGLATALGPAVISIALGQPNADVARLVALVVGSFFAWLLAAALLGAATDVVLVRWLAGDVADAEAGAAVGEAASGAGAAGTAGHVERSGSALAEVLRVAVVRAVAHLPLLLVAGWGLARLVEVTRTELIMPGDLAVPLVLRVVLGAPEVFAVLAVAWLAGEVVGELAARGVVLGGRSAARALGGAIADAVRDAPATLATLLLGTVGLVVLVAPPVLAASVAWTGLRDALLGDGSSAAALAGALVLALAWLGLLVLAGIAATWRSALWTAQAIRLRAARTAGDVRVVASRLPSAPG